MAAQVGEAVAQRRVAEPRDGSLVGEQLQRRPRDDEEHRHRRGEAAHHREPEPEVARLPDEQRGERDEARAVRDERAAPRRAGLAPDHAHRGHVLQLDERRQREAEQQHHADQEALHRGQHARRRQVGAHHLGDRGRDRFLRDEAEHAPCGARPEAEH